MYILDATFKWKYSFCKKLFEQYLVHSFEEHISVSDSPVLVLDKPKKISFKKCPTDRTEVTTACYLKQKFEIVDWIESNVA
jgi:hypothetical protein